MKTVTTARCEPPEATDITQIRANAKAGSLWVTDVACQKSATATVCMLVYDHPNYNLVRLTAAPCVLIAVSDIKDKILANMYPWYGELCFKQTPT